MTRGRKIGFIGGGNMARAIAGGLLRSGFDAAGLFLAEPDAERRAILARELPGAAVVADNLAVASVCDTLVLAVKPQILGSVCRELKETVQETQPLVLSIAAGPTIADVDGWLGGGARIVRVMPNQPALIDQGISVLIANERAGKAERLAADRIMSAVGETVWIDDESLMDAVTAVSGTGPAYVYLLADMMIESAVGLGLEPEIAKKLVLATARGAAALAETEPESMAALIERVRSPGGTTTAALERLEAANVRAIFDAAIRAAKDRSNDLAAKARQAGI
jgi:pyrroline-5-carboxylate reductase